MQLEEFCSRYLDQAIRMPRWVILTATKKQPYRSPENVAANEELRRTLETRHLPFMTVSGVWLRDDQGPNFLATGVDEPDAVELGRQFGQDSVLTSRGLLWSDGRVQLADHRATVIGDQARTKEFYSVLPDGTAFSMGISDRWIYSP